MEKEIELNSSEVRKLIEEAERKLGNVKIASIEYLEHLADVAQAVDERFKSDEEPEEVQTITKEIKKRNVIKGKKLKKKPNQEKRFKCDQCQSIFKMKDQLTRHKRIHERVYKCDRCDYQGKGFGNLKTHKLIHSEEKPFKCDQCEYSCKTTSALREHKQRHTGDLPFKCDQCDYKCSKPYRLVIHRYGQRVSAIF